MKIAGIYTQPPPPAEKLQALKAILPHGIPADYVSFFERYNGVEIGFDDVDYGRDEFDCLRLDSVDEMLNFREVFSELLPDLFVIGSDAGGQYLAYDMSQQTPWPIVIHLPGYSEAGNRSVVASSMTEFLQNYLNEEAPPLPYSE